MLRGSGRQSREGMRAVFSWECFILLCVQLRYESALSVLHLMSRPSAAFCRYPDWIWHEYRSASISLDVMNHGLSLYTWTTGSGQSQTGSEMNNHSTPSGVERSQISPRGKRTAKKADRRPSRSRQVKPRERSVSQLSICTMTMCVFLLISVCL